MIEGVPVGVVVFRTRVEEEALDLAREATTEAGGVGWAMMLARGDGMNVPSGRMRRWARLSGPLSYGRLCEFARRRPTSSLFILRRILSNFAVRAAVIHSATGTVHFSYNRLWVWEMWYIPCFRMNRSQRKQADLLEPMHRGGRCNGCCS